MKPFNLRKIISTQKVPLKGFTVQSFKGSTKLVQGGKGKRTLSKLTMPITFKKGVENPIKLKKETNGINLLRIAMKSKAKKS